MMAGRAYTFPEAFAELAREIERLRRRYASTRRELPDAQEAFASWAVEVNDLCWFLPLADVVEAGRDFILRAKTGWFNRNGESVGRWVGCVERPEGPVFFALNIDTPRRQADLPRRIEIVREAMRGIDAWPVRSGT